MTYDGGKPHPVGDRGQRYEITFLDPADNCRKVFGWSETESGAQALAECVQRHPVWTSPRICDRKPDLTKKSTTCSAG